MDGWMGEETRESRLEEELDGQTEDRRGVGVGQPSGSTKLHAAMPVMDRRCPLPNILAEA